jgi:AmiR/NasT family two-component response regulator
MPAIKVNMDAYRKLVDQAMELDTSITSLATLIIEDYFEQLDDEEED